MSLPAQGKLWGSRWPDVWHTSQATMMVLLTLSLPTSYK